jgi:plasmid replication initiation protein
MEIIKQSNYITNARYSFSDYEIKVLVYIIKDIQRILSSETPEVQKDLLGEIDHKVYFTLSSIDDDNPKRIRESLIALREKTISIDDADGGWTDVGVISRSRYIKSAKKYEIKIDECLMPYMVSLAKGFTTYQLETTMLLNANAKRLYFLFSEFANTGVFRIDASTLKENIGLTGLYKQYDDFKRSVLTRAINEINGLFKEDKCDLFVEIVNDKKVRNKLDWDRTIEFRIASNKKKTFVNVPQEDKVKMYQEIGGLLTAVFKEDFKVQEKIYSYFADRADMPKFHKKLVEKCTEQEAKGKPYKDLAPLIRHIAQKDFGFEKNTAQKAEEKAKKQDNYAAALANRLTHK